MLAGKARTCAELAADTKKKVKDMPAATAGRSLAKMVDLLGTKLAHVVVWVRDLLARDSTSKVILFSAVSQL